MWFKSYEHFHLLTTDERTRTACIVHLCGSCNTVKTLNTCYTGTVESFCRYILETYHVVQELNAFFTDLDRPDWCSAKPRHRFAYQCLDNVKMYKYAYTMRFKSYEHFTN